MRNQKNNSTQPLILNTSRQFYSRRIITPRNNSNGQIDRVLKLLNIERAKKHINIVRVQTQFQQQHEHNQTDRESMQKLTKMRVQNWAKKQGKEWQELLQLYDTVKRSSSKEVFVLNDCNFLTKFGELMKTKGKKQVNNNAKSRQGIHDNRNGRVQLQNIKLLRENELLKKQLNINEDKNNNNQKTYISKGATEFNLLQQQQKRLCSDLVQLQKQVEVLRQENDLLRFDKKSLSMNIQELMTSNENLIDQILRLKTANSQQIFKFNNWKNIMAMQHEQILSLVRQLCDIRKSYIELHRKYQYMLKRMSKLNVNSQNQIMEVTKKSLEVFTEQIESFMRIRGYFLNLGYLNVSGGQRDKEKGKMCYKKYMNSKECISNSEGVKKTLKDYCRYFRPAFFIFIEKYFQYQGVDRENFDQINLGVDINFLATLRAILDSKHNEYLLARRLAKQLSSLSSFTISWLCNYTTDVRTKHQVQINSDMSFETIGSFYARLMSPALNGNWQVITFRQLLLDTLTVDELLFYLKTRFLLLKGDGLAGAGAFLEIYYVNYMDALYIVQQVVSDFDYRKKLGEYIKHSVQFQKRKQLVDAHFILRLLLQFYQYKKAKIFDSLTKTFPLHTREHNNNMNFETFLKIFDYNFCQLTHIDKVQIYQKAFSLGRGTVTIQSVFTVITEEGFLCLEVENLFLPPHFIFKQKKTIIGTGKQKNPHIFFKEVDQIIQYFQQEGDKQMKQEIASLGVEYVRLDYRQQKQAEQISYDILLQKIQQIIHLGICNLKKMFFTKKVKQDELVKYFPFLINFAKQFIKTTIERRYFLNLIDDIAKKNAARLIMKFYRRKKASINRSYMVAGEQFQRNNQKSQQIREQFKDIISNLKSKYASIQSKVQPEFTE